MRSINPIRESCGDKKMLIKDICTSITDGSHNPPQGIASSSYLMLSSKNVFDDKITLDEPRFLSEEDFAKENKRTNVKCGDILLTIVGTVGRAAVVSSDLPPFTLQRSVAVLHLKEEVCSSRYLMYALRGKRSYIESHSKGVAQKGIYLKEVAGIDLPVHPKAMQEKITNRLDKLAFIIKCRQQELQKLDDLVRARFIELFGNPVENPKGYYVATLQELINKGFIMYHLDGNHGGDYPKSEEFVDNGVPYISANCIVNDEIDFSKAKFLTPERAGKLRKGIAQNDDVLFAHNATVGPTVVLHTDEEKVILGTSLTAYRCNKEKIMPNYLKAYMLSDEFVRQYSGDMKQTTRNQVPITAQKKYLFLIPPIEEQKQFAAFAVQIAKSKAAVQKALDQAQLLFDSLMQEYFG